MPTARSDRAAEKALDDLYAQLPKLTCKGQCQECCGPIQMSRVEWDRIKGRVGHSPRARTLTCPLLILSSGRCKVYAVRPMICRLWGVVEDMRCPWGCQPERWLTREEGFEFLRRAQEVGR